MTQVATLSSPPDSQADAPLPVLPATIDAAFAPVSDLPAAELYTRELTLSHYENFSVISRLLPRHLRQDFCNVYAFCRTADDLSDEVGDTQRALDYLARFKEQTHVCYAGQSTTAVFVALSDTIKRHDIPIQPFLDLIDAFEQDQRITRYDTYDQLLDYCRRSADPVGRLVLYMCGHREEPLQRLSDKTCTALQLTNFWQDVRRDLRERDRIYIPHDTLDWFGVTEEHLRGDKCYDNYRRMIRNLCKRTHKLFDAGERLLPMLDRSIRPQIALFTKGGRATLNAIAHRNYDTLTRRPSLSKWTKMRLVFSTYLRTYLSGGNK